MSECFVISSFSIPVFNWMLRNAFSGSPPHLIKLILHFRRMRKRLRPGTLTTSSWTGVTPTRMTWTKATQSSVTGSTRQAAPWSTPAPGLSTRPTVGWRWELRGELELVLSSFYLQPNYTSIINTCNLWRNFDDIQDSWSSVERTIDYYGDHQDIIIANAGPGHWNDPDMVRYDERGQGGTRFIPVDHRQLRSVLRAVQDPDGDVGNIRCPSPHVGGPENHQARLQSNPEK